jgi:hypothetical protein
MSHPKILECEINKRGTMFACLDLKFDRELKLFVLFKSLIRKKPFLTFYYSLKNSFEKIRFQNTILCLFKTYASIFAREISTKCFILNKVYIS